MTKRPQIGHDGTSGEEMTNDEVDQPQQGGQVQVGGPLFQAMGMRQRAQIGYLGTIGYDMTRYDVSQYLHGGQDQDGGPQLPLLGHGDEVESPNWACRCLSQALGC